MVYLITGKSGAGKTHYAKALVYELEADHIPVKWIDGDVFRDTTANQDYSDCGRFTNLISAALQAQHAEKMGFVVIVSFIAPKREWRDAMRMYWKQSRVIYLPGGTLWEGTNYEKPLERELWLD